MNKRDFLKSVCLAPIIGAAGIAEAKTRVVYSVPQLIRYGDAPFIMKTPPKIDISKLETDFLSLAADNYDSLKNYIVVVVNDEITEGVTQADCANGFAVIPQGNYMCTGHVGAKIQILFKSDKHRYDYFINVRKIKNPEDFTQIRDQILIKYGRCSQEVKFFESKTRIRRILNDKYGVR